MLSDSVKVRGGVGGADEVLMSPDIGKLEMEKLSSDQEMLSRRSAAVERRFPTLITYQASPAPSCCSYCRPRRRIIL